jgi:hypothetical protein
MHADAWTVLGESRIQLAQPRAGLSTDATIQVDICLDVSDVALVDTTGSSVVDSDRRDVQSMSALMTYEPGSPTGLRIANVEGREGAPECVQ